MPMNGISYQHGGSETTLHVGILSNDLKASHAFFQLVACI
jgi:hypothetical protein